MNAFNETPRPCVTCPPPPPPPPHHPPLSPPPKLVYRHRGFKPCSYGYLHVRVFTRQGPGDRRGGPGHKRLSRRQRGINVQPYPSPP